MSNTEGTLLVCPNCTANGHYTSFGSITPKGEVIVKRKFNRKSVIIASEFVLLCDCGYSIYYAKGVISEGQEAPSYTYEQTF